MIQCGITGSARGLAIPAGEADYMLLSVLDRGAGTETPCHFLAVSGEFRAIRFIAPYMPR